MSMAASRQCVPYGAVPLVLLVLLLWPGAGAGAGGRMVGGRMAVEDVESDREIQELGLFCVVEYNRRGGYSGHRLLFSRVMAAQTQVVSGIKYYLRVAARGGHGADELVFDAVVVVKAWMPPRVLVSFVPADVQP